MPHAYIANIGSGIISHMCIALCVPGWAGRQIVMNLFDTVSMSNDTWDDRRSNCLVRFGVAALAARTDRYSIWRRFNWPIALSNVIPFARTETKINWFGCRVWGHILRIIGLEIINSIHQYLRIGRNAPRWYLRHIRITYLATYSLLYAVAKWNYFCSAWHCFLSPTCSYQNLDIINSCISARRSLDTWPGHKFIFTLQLVWCEFLTKAMMHVAIFKICVARAVKPIDKCKIELNIENDNHSKIFHASHSLFDGPDSQ